MNIFGSYLQLADRGQLTEGVEHKLSSKNVRLAVGGCLLFLLVCGFLYLAAKQARQQNKVVQQQLPIHAPIIEEQLKKILPMKTEQLAMQKVNLPAPPEQQIQQAASQQSQMTKTQAPVAEQKHKPAARSKAPAVKVTEQKKSVVKQVNPASKQAAKVVDVSKHQSRTSEHLLRQTEMGEGPSIDINWPSDVSQRRALFSTLVDCLGVGLGVLINGSVTPIHDSGRDYSRLVRMVGGKMVEREARLHRQSGINGIAVRLFPRDIDSRLLAGLASITRQPLSKYSQVQGVYVLSGGSLWVKNIYFDGTLSEGQILLARGACRR